jgi:hypothetical protein
MAGQALRLDRLPKFDPERQTQLVEFLGNPIDSHVPYESPRKFVTQFNGTSVLGAAQRASEDQAVEKMWEERFARVRDKVPGQQSKRSSKSALSHVGSSLFRRLNKPRNGDPFNRLCVEEIADRRGEVVQGPIQKLSQLPALRCAPKGILSDKMVRRMRHWQ